MGVVAAAWVRAGPGPEGGSVCGRGTGAAGPGDEPGYGVDAGAGGVLVPGGENGSPLGWSLVLYKNP